ncbi:MAG: malate synthase A [Flammeovirgaceae bacterium]|nr:malate synthase A [Flammeovirgaceae bacterium]
MATTAEIKSHSGLRIEAPILLGADRVLSPEAIQFITTLHREFNSQRLHLLSERKKRQKQLDQGKLPDFLPETNFIREGNWQVSQIPQALQDRRVEITGPVDRKMIINALNSGAKVFMADFEDSTSPTWRNVIEGQLNLMDAVRETISYESPEGKTYALNEELALLNVRPRGWHLDERHVLIDGEAVSASLFDFGLFVFHNGALLAAQEKGPFFYLPKLESHLEAKLWDDIFLFAERSLGISRGTIKATVLIETILAAFEMEEIIYQLREHIAGLNAGRWDYIFSIIKKLKNQKAFVMPDRAKVTMAVPFMSAYAQLLVKTCHKRGVHAIGGMSAFIPSKDEQVNREAFEKVKADKIREALHGYDGTWVAHPKLVNVAKAEFDKVLGENPHQKEVLRKAVNVTARELLNIRSAGNTITEKGIRTNINVAILYIESWLHGMGAAALHNLMEDAATAEISRAQLWQWLHQGNVVLSDGRMLNLQLYQQLEEEEFTFLVQQFNRENQSIECLITARELLKRLVMNNEFEEFLTTLAYQYID